MLTVHNADDLKVDVPNASRILSQFVARAVVDEILPPVFLTDPTVVSLGGQVIQDAVTFLSVKHGQARVEKVWGPGASEFADDLKRTFLLLFVGWLVFLMLWILVVFGGGQTRLMAVLFNL
jgi:hypothetical protein